MKLNPDCIRGLLLIAEDKTRPGRASSFAATLIRKDFPFMKEFTEEEIYYHALQCEMSGFFSQFHDYGMGEWSIMDITPKAHSFLANVREETIWNGVKSVAAKIGCKSMDAVVQIASNVVTELIKSQFGLSSKP